MRLSWSLEKNETLKARYGFGFEKVLKALDEGRLLERRRHPNVQRYPHQKQLVVEIDEYAGVVPYVELETGIFMKTMFPSRRATRDFLGGGK
ncbi:toxin [Jiella sonneratiae]|uniref:Toxin n=1 Tax=Jiella sonneratiae TaxID=2816856 RepID=A0ABS3J2U8_9HYPH|nr:toxin [Jiella sonneratiae]MBO0903978.1 toxin [Jiella sonneratiae]